MRSIARISAEFTLLWFFSNYFYNAGLASTSVSSSTVLSNTSSIFVYLVGICLLDGIKFNAGKAMMVLTSFAGIWIVAISDQKNDNSDQYSGSEIKGDILSLLAAMFYGLYAVILKKRVPEE